MRGGPPGMSVQINVHVDVPEFLLKHHERLQCVDRGVHRLGGDFPLAQG